MDKLRRKLHEYIEIYGIESSEVLKISKELDSFVVEAQLNYFKSKSLKYSVNMQLENINKSIFTN